MTVRDTLIEIVRQWTERNDGAPETPEAVVDAFRAEVLAANGDVTAERDCLAMAVMFARQWGGGTPFELHQGIDEILATMPGNREKSSRAAVATPDFFEPGHSYTHRDGSTFRCVAVTTHPNGGERVAVGWHTDTAGWTFIGFRNINHWNHEYDGVQPPAVSGEVSS
ncbi:hypothetical protein ACFYOF_16770 [Streptomyces sp. NPDC007148]|uniref:hypothetical protein n=1 Tax=Streptomyces sp. NPDC007148 TaxID=3364775 RepID=UPI0036C570DB